VSRCARDGFTVVIHGKHQHEETRATASQALIHPQAHYLCVRNLDEARIVCGFLRGTVGASTLRERFAHASSRGFNPELHLERIGLANQTTMLMSETQAVQAMLREAMLERVGADHLDGCFRAFDTICSATQDRQDAVRALLEAGSVDVMIVIGGYNSSNTQALARMCAACVPTFHIDAAACIERDSVRHKPVGDTGESRTTSWLTPGSICIGITAGASTPDSVVGDVLDRILSLRGATAQSLFATRLIA
jgi:4-hydroxy-3-methylbut-2-enyl diphosphate reductase